MKLTISVLIYNVEEYLNFCLKSILEQATDNVQILLIDDGSTDSSGAISDYYATTDDRIKVIHKKNGGISSARNEAIDNAAGEYIWFVDGDDVIVKNSIHKLLDYLNTALTLPEVMICDYFCFNKDAIKPQVIENVMSNKGEYISGGQSAFLWGNSIFGTVWNCLFQRQFVLNSQKRFDEDLYCNEDEDWLVSILPLAQSISIFNEFIYNYRTDRLGSITNDSDLLKRFKCRYKVYTKWFDYYSNCHFQNMSTKHMTAYFSQLYIGLASELKAMDVRYKREALQMYKSKLYIASSAPPAYPFKWFS